MKEKCRNYKRWECQVSDSMSKQPKIQLASYWMTISQKLIREKMHILQDLKASMEDLMV